MVVGTNYFELKEDMLAVVKRAQEKYTDGTYPRDHLPCRNVAAMNSRYLCCDGAKAQQLGADMTDGTK